MDARQQAAVLNHLEGVGHEVAGQVVDFLGHEHLPALLSPALDLPHALFGAWVAEALVQAPTVLLKQRHPEAVHLHSYSLSMASAQDSDYEKETLDDKWRIYLFCDVT